VKFQFTEDGASPCTIISYLSGFWDEVNCRSKRFPGELIRASIEGEQRKGTPKGLISTTSKLRGRWSGGQDIPVSHPETILH